MADRTKIVITVLVVIIAAFVLFTLYYFVVQPVIQGYIVEKQTEGVQIAVSAILSQIQQNGFVQIPLDGNQTLVLVPYNPSQ